MAKKMFNKKLSHHCEYCVHGTTSDYANEVLCKKHGIVSKQDSCRHYVYDPLKREPKKVKIENNFEPEDFLL